MADERISKHEREFAASERRMGLILIQGSNALFEGEQRLIDFCSVNSGLFILLSHISCSFAAGQIDKTDLSVEFRLVFFDLNL